MGINELKKILKSPQEGIIISSPENRRYFTGFPSSDGFLLITESRAVFFTDSRYIEAAEQSIKNCETRLLTRVSAEIKAFLSEIGITRLLSERERLTVSQLSALKSVLDGIKIAPSVALENKINALREIKTQGEKEKILKAQSIAEGAFRHILGFIKPNITEKEIALELDFYMLSHGAEALSFETIAVTGKKTSMPHGVPDRTKVKIGDFVTMDFGAVYEGYHSDMTRTVAVGKASSEQRKVYETVLTAQAEALKILKKGISCAEADKAARDIITAAGYGDFFGHGTGHGVGIEIHENPSLSPRSGQKLKAGNIVTVEPGIYIPGKFGVRIEDMAYITSDGCENLTSAPKELIIL